MKVLKIFSWIVSVSSNYIYLQLLITQFKNRNIFHIVFYYLRHCMLLKLLECKPLLEILWHYDIADFLNFRNLQYITAGISKGNTITSILKLLKIVIFWWWIWNKAIVSCLKSLILLPIQTIVCSIFWWHFSYISSALMRFSLHTMHCSFKYQTQNHD